MVLLVAGCSARVGTRVPDEQGNEKRSLLYRRPLAGVNPSTTAPPASTPPGQVPVVAPPTTQPVAPTTTSTVPPQVDSWRLPTAPSSVGGCQTFDQGSVFHSLAIGLPVHPRSDEWIAHLGADEPPKIAMDTRVWQGSRPGIPINVVDSRQLAPSDIVYDASFYPVEDWITPVPIPPDMRIEGDPTPAWDKHALIVDSATCTAYELFYYERLYRQLLGFHWAASAAKWDLRAGGALVPQRGTTVSAIPLLGGMTRVDELNSGRIDHVLNACSMFNGPDKVWPARTSDGTDQSPSALPVGARLRLRSDVDRNRFTGQSRVIVEAMANHGVMITDTCYFPLAIDGENSATGWDDANLDQLDALRLGDFEVVDQSPMIISEDSWEVR